MIRSKPKEVEDLSKVEHLSVATSALWQFFAHKNDFAYVKIVLNFSILFYWGVSHFEL